MHSWLFSREKCCSYACNVRVFPTWNPYLTSSNAIVLYWSQIRRCHFLWEMGAGRWRRFAWCKCNIVGLSFGRFQLLIFISRHQKPPKTNTRNTLIPSSVRSYYGRCPLTLLIHCNTGKKWNVLQSRTEIWTTISSICFRIEKSDDGLCFCVNLICYRIDVVSLNYIISRIKFIFEHSWQIYISCTIFSSSHFTMNDDAIIPYTAKER